MFNSFVVTLFTVLIGVVRSQDCASDEFKCQASGACISTHLVCDGIIDCLNGTDELNCPAATTTECPGFQCPNSKYCIPSIWICDGDNDCGDMSDEDNCPSTVSTPCSGFVCNTGECLPDYWQCDSEPDCENGEDEAGCACEGFQCPSGLCIPNGWTCDGDNDCGDYSDEKEEKCPCTDDEVRCPAPEEGGVSGVCLIPEYICDSDDIWDCPDGSDQANCTTQGSGNTSNSPTPVGRRRPETVRAGNVHHLSKQEEKKAIEQRHSEKRQSPFYKNRSSKREKRRA